jgi:hypothetical protein
MKRLGLIIGFGEAAGTVGTRSCAIRRGTSGDSAIARKAEAKGERVPAKKAQECCARRQTEASRHTAPIGVNTREALQISSLKGDQISTQGFDPGLDNTRRCVLKGHQTPARHIRSKSSARVSSFSRHFQGAFLRGEHPGLKPWAKPFCPFGAQSFYPSLILTRMRNAGSRRSASLPPSSLNPKAARNT